jgi:hypothetical protein
MKEIISQLDYLVFIEIAKWNYNCATQSEKTWKDSSWVNAYNHWSLLFGEMGWKGGTTNSDQKISLYYDGTNCHRCKYNANTGPHQYQLLS